MRRHELFRPSFTSGFDLEIRYWLEIIHKYGFICVNRGTRDRYRENRLHSAAERNHFTVYRGIAGYGFYILIIAYPLISFRPVNRSPKNPRIKLALSRMDGEVGAGERKREKETHTEAQRIGGAARLSIKVIEAADERVNLDCIESSIVLSIDTDMCKQNLYLRAVVR